MCGHKFNKIKMKATATLIKPLHHRRSKSAINNIFRETDEAEQMPNNSRENHENFDFVGPPEFRKKLIKKIQPTPKP